jgi:CRISPR system Cascade subunit CasA
MTGPRINLIHDPWIPVRAAGGKQRVIAPWQLTEGPDDLFVALAAPRPDFNGALIQFLIGLVQTTMAPRNDPEWRNALRSPPAPDGLRAAFQTVAHAFELEADGPRFMQDLTLGEADQPATVPIAGLLMDSPGENTERHNADLFIKRGRVEGLCPACAAMALFALQTNAPSGGAGHRTSLRGGGPLTTIILGYTLWETVWFNVLPAPAIRANPDAPLEQIFPWLAPTRTSEPGTGRGTTPAPGDADPRQAFWGMPRRIRLLFDPAAAGPCDLCGAPEGILVQRYWTRNYGVNYEGAWRHPLTPHTRGEDRAPQPRHAQQGGIGYRHWLGLVHAISDARFVQEPAEVVSVYLQNRWQPKMEYRLWAFGYDMDNMKARCLYEGRMPLIHVPPNRHDDFQHAVRRMVDAAREVGNNLRQCVRNGLFAKPVGVERKGGVQWKLPPGFKPDKALFNGLAHQFWQATEPPFYESVATLAQGLTSQDEDELLREGWLRRLHREAQALFDLWVNSGDLGDGDPRRIALARRDLGRWNHGPKLRGLLDLPARRADQPPASGAA